MLKSVLMPLVIGTAVAMSGAALADSSTTTKEPYKNVPTAGTMPKAGSVQPGAQESMKRYKDTENFTTGVKSNDVKPKAPINKDLYSATPESPQAPEGNEKTK